jgi:hypothetical protein
LLLIRCLSTRPPLLLLLMHGGGPTGRRCRADDLGAYSFTAQQYGQPVALSKYAGQVVVFVNIASE